jgi:Icc protein
MLLVQLSDPHIGGTYFKQEIFDTIVNEVKNKLKPDVILITGDLTDEGLILNSGERAWKSRSLQMFALRS